MSSAKERDLAALVLDLIDNPAGHSKAMFGGIGLYVDTAMFGLIADGEVYFKTDDHNKNQFIENELQPFVFTTSVRKVTMSYYSLPETALDSSAEMAIWYEPSLAAARRAATKRNKQKSRKNLRSIKS